MSVFSPDFLLSLHIMNCLIWLLSVILIPLSAIDTLMQSQPDSALTLLLDEPTDEPYYQLLLSEALYKNYYTQTNRTELLASLAYFDSVQDPFLSARCHYMNGVAYYEMDSVVQACEEYMTAIQIMEEHYSEKELTGHKAKFMALTYLRLTTLFSDQYLHEQAVFFGKQSLSFYNKHDAESWNIPWVLREIGSQYDMMGQLEDADYYYRMAMDALSDTCTLTYRDIASLRMLLYYHKENKSQVSLKQLHKLLTQAQSNNEYLSRCAVIGDIYYCEQQLDLAWFYLNKVYSESTNVNLKKQAAEFLAEICKSLGKDAEFIEYAGFLVPFANQEENKSELKSHLTELYCRFIKNNQVIEHQRNTNKRMKWFGAIFGNLVFTLILLWVLHKNKKHHLEAQITAERLAYETQQKAMAKRLQASNKALNNQKKEKEALLKELKEHQVQATWDNLEAFLNEDICVEIMDLLHDKCIKREAKSCDHQDLWLKDQQLSLLFAAVERHFNGFSKILTLRYPKIRPNEMDQCLLCLLDLKDVQIAALLHSDYSTIKKRSVKLTKAFGTEKTLQTFVRELVL